MSRTRGKASVRPEILGTPSRRDGIYPLDRKKSWTPSTTQGDLTQLTEHLISGITFERPQVDVVSRPILVRH